MTLKPLTLDQYFQLIVNKPVKEQRMLDLSMFFTAQLEKLKSLWTKPTTFVDNSVLLEDEDYWAFEMVTQPWIDEHGEAHPLKHTVMIEPHEGTWMQVLDQILDAMNDHYGYDIKEQVYYSVAFPLNEVDERTGKPFAGYGRSLNDGILQQLLLAYPEIYETVPFGGRAKKGIFE